MKFVRYLLTAMGLGLAGGGIYLIIQPPPDEGIVKYLPAAMFLFFALLTFKVWLPMVKDVDHGDLLRTGDTAMATIAAVDQTGTRINEQPVFKFTLDVARADGKISRMTTKQIVSLTSIGVLRPGMVVPVRIDPNKPGRVAIDSQRANEIFNAGATPPAGVGTPAAMGMPAATGMPSTGMTPGQTPPVAGMVRSADVVRDGVSAEATVQMVSLSGMAFGQMRPSDADESTKDDPMVMLALLVTVSDGSTFTAQGIHRVPQDQLSEMTPGRTVPVAYLPNDPVGTTCVDWERL